ncbi:MAG: ABC transporter ATP-binding protein/permease, partial [Clostridiales bacterium]|nr:ABC transporter ATP-binding protein/permease [Clostridiales bacterium]
MFQKKEYWRKFFSFYAPYKLLFTADLFCALVVTAVSLVLPLCVRYITRDVLTSLGGGVESIAAGVGVGGGIDDKVAVVDGFVNARAEIFRTGLLMLGLIAAQTVAGLFFDHMGHDMGARMERDMRNEFFAHCQRLPVSFFDRQRVGALMSRVTNDLLTLAELFHHGPENLVIYVVRFVGALIIMFRVNAGLTLAVCAFLPVMAAYSLFYMGRLSAAYKASRESLAEAAGTLEDSLAGIRTVKAFAAEETELVKFRTANERFYRSRSAIYKHEARYYTGLEYFFGALVTASVTIFGALWILNQSIDAADFIAFLLYVGYLIDPIPRLAQIIGQFQDGMAGFARFMEVMETEPEPTEGLGAAYAPVTASAQASAPASAAALASVPSPESCEGRVAFCGVGFRYGEDRDFTLRGLTFQIEPGETVALTGASGIGKTTICSLLQRFYEPSEGCITLDGADIRRYPPRALRRLIGVVQQDVYLFSGSVRENIRYGRPDATDAEVVEAAKRAYADEFIRRLPDGYDADVGQRGVRLSGGQRQRISIARVLLASPPILIFDEATSALDDESERLVQEA